MENSPEYILEICERERAAKFFNKIKESPLFEQISPENIQNWKILQNIYWRLTRESEKQNLTKYPVQKNLQENIQKVKESPLVEQISPANDLQENIQNWRILQDRPWKFV